MQTVTIEGTDYPVYADLETADLYLVASSSAVIWQSALDDDDIRRRALVTATRIMDRQRWTTDYDTQAKRENVQNIIDACCEIASALLQGSDLESSAVTGQKLQSITAGSVSLTYFRGADGTPHRFPTIVWELLRDYLGGSGGGFFGVATGTGGISSTADDFGHTDPV